MTTHKTWQDNDIQNSMYCFIIYLPLANEESEVPNVGCSHRASWHLSAFVFGTADPFGATECLLQGQATGFRPEGWALFIVSQCLSRRKRLKRYETWKRCLLPILSWHWWFLHIRTQEVVSNDDALVFQPKPFICVFNAGAFTPIHPSPTWDVPRWRLRLHRLTCTPTTNKSKSRPGLRPFRNVSIAITDVLCQVCQPTLISAFGSAKKVVPPCIFLLCALLDLVKPVEWTNSMKFPAGTDDFGRDAAVSQKWQGCHVYTAYRELMTTLIIILATLTTMFEATSHSGIPPTPLSNSMNLVYFSCFSIVALVWVEYQNANSRDVFWQVGSQEVTCSPRVASDYNCSLVVPRLQALECQGCNKLDPRTNPI